MVHKDLKIYGIVQGVWFRSFAKTKADELGITGFAENESDETVRVEAEGEEPILERFIEWCRIGSEYAKVEKVEVKEGAIKNFKKFLVK